MKDKGKKFLQEFKEFAMKGNVLDLAIGVVMGGAFNKIVSSLVENIIMPLVGLLIGGVKFEDLTYVFNIGIGEAEIKYGIFIQNVVDFIIIAFSIFVFIKVVAKLNRKKEEEEVEEESPAEAELTAEQVLLTEIRDILKDSKKQDNVEV
ncbi:large-conductance mechanosensitive channel protein MscL [Clostridium sartagoforme]|uniref:Large-conductance mechanosensitive channel n=1 Tax=Clostridium sartagoforme TaxID=84031 RepID=A0A4S2DL68_9CLOT|nr:MULTISPECIES: large-conductance mechanosensitive channel protein MscL [Clostridium]MBS5939128.1 large-conductance mechanosensitive channel protein MscL [Clostridium sp.]TGY41724.1 large-conductance mechanosensitive channel protein MscL [Clostridium sartagoforme]